MQQDPLTVPPCPYSPPAARLAASEPSSLLAEAWRRLAEKPWLLLGSYLAVVAPAELFLMATGLGSTQGWTMPETFAWLPVLQASSVCAFVEVTVGGMAAAGVIYAASADGSVTTVGQALLRALRSWPRMVGARVLVMIAMLAGIGAFVFPFFFVALALSQVDYVVALEDKSAFAALKRSYQLTRHRLFYLLGMTLLTTALATLASVPVHCGGELLVWLEPRLDHFLMDFVLRMADSARYVFLIVFMLCVYEKLVREQDS